MRRQMIQGKFALSLHSVSGARVWARGTMNSIGVEFEDGFRTVTARYAIRKVGSDGR